MTLYIILKLINITICFAGLFICACRAGKLPGLKTRAAVKAQYTLTGTAFSGLMLSPPEFYILAISSTLLVLLLVTMPRWRYGPPREVYKRHFVNSPHTDDVISFGQ